MYDDYLYLICTILSKPSYCTMPKCVGKDCVISMGSKRYQLNSQLNNETLCGPSLIGEVPTGGLVIA